MAARPKHLPKKAVKWFPLVDKYNHEVTSDHDPKYNCIAYAAGITNKKYWPNFHPDYYWPPGLPKVEKIESFIKLYESFGYSVMLGEVSNNLGYSAENEKIAIYTKADGTPTHAALQIGPNKWTSKLGDWYDIEHLEKAVSAGDYGNISLVMNRPRN